MTTTVERISLDDFLEGVIADLRNGNNGGSLSDEMCEAGARLWDDTLEVINQASSLCIANSGYCADLDLPQGSTSVECLAAALDAAIQINGTNHLSTISHLIDENGLTNA